MSPPTCHLSHAVYDDHTYANWSLLVRVGSFFQGEKELPQSRRRFRTLVVSLCLHWWRPTRWLSNRPVLQVLYWSVASLCILLKVWNDLLLFFHTHISPIPVKNEASEEVHTQKCTSQQHTSTTRLGSDSFVTRFVVHSLLTWIEDFLHKCWTRCNFFQLLNKICLFLFYC